MHMAMHMYVHGLRTLQKLVMLLVVPLWHWIIIAVVDVSGFVENQTYAGGNLVAFTLGWGLATFFVLTIDLAFPRLLPWLQTAGKLLATLLLFELVGVLMQDKTSSSMTAGNADSASTIRYWSLKGVQFTYFLSAALGLAERGGGNDMSVPAVLALCFISNHMGRMFMPWHYLISELFEEQLGQVLFYADHPSYFRISPCDNHICPSMISGVAILGVVTMFGAVLVVMSIGALISYFYFLLARRSQPIAALYFLLILTTWFVGVPLIVHFKHQIGVPCVQGERTPNLTPPPLPPAFPSPIPPPAAPPVTPPPPIAPSSSPPAPPPFSPLPPTIPRPSPPAIPSPPAPPPFSPDPPSTPPILPPPPSAPPSAPPSPLSPPSPATPPPLPPDGKCQGKFLTDLVDDSALFTGLFLIFGALCQMWYYVSSLPNREGRMESRGSIMDLPALPRPAADAPAADNSAAATPNDAPAKATSNVSVDADVVSLNAKIQVLEDQVRQLVAREGRAQGLLGRQGKGRRAREKKEGRPDTKSHRYLFHKKGIGTAVV